MRADQFVPQLDNPDYDSRSFHDAFALILSGLFKKLVISSYLSEHIVRDVFQVPAAYSSLTVLLGVYAYSIQIYCDFSGYSDMAIGIAQLLGFRLPQNFLHALRSLQCPRVLASLAYIVFHLAQRLPVHPSGRQQERDDYASI